MKKKEARSSDTIAAIATPLGEGGIGIVRISGQNALPILTAVFQRNGQNPQGNIISHRLYQGQAIDPKTGKILDEAVAAYMKNPKSYTGEDCAEISCHGGTALLTQVLEAVIETGARIAKRGEFTKRAFLNGKIDLIQAEAVIDLIKAKTKAGVYAAANQLKGKLSKEVSDTRGRLLNLLARIEASIDFPEDVEEIAGETISRRIAEEKGKLGYILATADAGKILKEGFPTVIIGKPNVGKSSLLNALLREDRAIVTEIPGTTRDTIEEHINVKGLPLKIIDTAGVRTAKDRIEEMGIERTKEAIEQAGLSLVVIDISEDLTREDADILGLAEGKKAIIVANKIDKAKSSIKEKNLAVAKKILKDSHIVEASALYGDGIAELEERIAGLVSSGLEVDSDGPIITNIRHKESLTRAKEALGRAEESAAKGMQADFIAIDLKTAAVALGEATGEEVSEEVLDRIFSEFCIGK